MGMGYSAAYADVITDASIKEFCKKEFEEFMGKIGSCNVDFEEFSQNASYEYFEDYDEDLIRSFKNLQEAFEKATGLSLNLSFHNSEDGGDRYDDVDGSYWYVEGMYQLTPAGKKMKDHVKRQTFVQFG